MSDKRYGRFCIWTAEEIASGSSTSPIEEDHEISAQLARDLIAAQARIAELATYIATADAMAAEVNALRLDADAKLAAAEATVARAERFVRALRSTAKISNVVCPSITADQLEAALAPPGEVPSE